MLCVVGFLLLLGCGWQDASAQEAPDAKEVLVIHSYHSGLKWTDDIHNAINQQFSISKTPVHLQVEYLDAKRYGIKAFAEQTARLLELKLAIRSYDLVLVSDDHAFQFVRNHRNGLFANIPIVFCGVNQFRPAMIEGLTAITGVEESPGFAETIELAMRLHAGTTEIVVINRTRHLTGEITKRVLDEVVSRFNSRVRFRFWSDLPWGELQNRLTELNPGQLVLLTDVIEDEDLGVLSFEESCQRIRQFCSVPLYGVWDFFLGQGIVGGKLLSGSDQGRLAAELAQRILNGESADAIPIVDQDIGKFRFDDKELRRFSIRHSALPAGSQIIKRDLPVYAIPKAKFLKVLFLLAGLALGGLFLLKNVYSRYRAEKALRETEAHFRGYFDLNLVGMITMSASGKWLEVNDRFCEMIKYSREELQRKSWIDVTHPDDLTESYEKFEALCAGEIDRFTQDKRYVCKDGALIHVELSTRALRQPDGRINRLVSIVQDITKRKAAEADLRLDEARLEALVALNQMGESSVEDIIDFIVSSVISLTKSKIGYLAFVNEAAGTLIKHGWTRGALQECTMEKSSAGYSIEKAGLWAEVVRHKKPIIINNYAYPQLVKKGIPEGHTSIERFMGVPLLDQDKVVAIIGVGNKAGKYDDADVRQLNLLGQGLVRLLESKRAEQGLLESQQKYKRLFRQFQALLDGIPDAIFLLTPDMNIVWGNEGAARHLGVHVKALPGESCCSLWTGQAETCPDCPVARCFESGKAEEQPLAYPDGKIWGVKAFPLKNAMGEVENVIKMAVDITEKVKLRDEAERSARLASLGELAAGVAHEINNPNGVLLLNSKILADFFTEALPELSNFLQKQGIESLAGLDASEMDTEIPQMLTDMQDSSKRINGIVKDLKRFVQSESTPFFSPVDLNEVVEMAVRLTGSTLKKFAPGFEVCHGADLPRVKGIFQQLEQVTINLVVNACQSFGDKKGNIFVSTYFDEALRSCILEVRDEGKGIDPKVLPHIAEPFFTTKRQNGGTGLGLSVSARIVREHGGKLDFFSLPGQGTTVRLALPALDEGEVL
ncbi:hypothetical protein A7E78_07945 [Syntrophotalea acetylenivorans]|uniref:histidine kinase n=1 Tax=Syntrophotalea acetylenivorans TaxID=1842532 RepID=A0A1L3GPD8_9BACT|nr:PAS domain S-box protein [Syntrophotalea acetylenivorans]APG27773.1 hypothetical protein A7E78_07945 [Syntrophotalea acetylenivorans]